MRQLSRSVSRSKRNLSSTPIKHSKSTRNLQESQVYFCHYKNAMYMGGTKAFQKHGRGIIIHDDGTSVVSSYLNDIRHGHNIFYKNNCIMSVEFNKNRVVECLIKIPSYLMLIRYSKEQKPDGRSVLLSYSDRQIVYALYRKGAIVEKKVQKDPSIISLVFDEGNIQSLVGDHHAQVVKYDIEKDQNIASQFISDKLYVGFYRKGFMNGLGFVLLSGSDETEELDFTLRPIERGYFYNNSINGMGQKWFKNGNYYIGDFKAGVFEGNGILKNERKNNWVLGKFENGGMSQLITYSHEGDVNKFQKLKSSMHERKNNWINNSIQILSQDQFILEMDKIMLSDPTQQVKSLKEKKDEVLRKIQSNFMDDDEILVQTNRATQNHNITTNRSISRLNADQISSKGVSNKSPRNQRQIENQFGSSRTVNSNYMKNQLNNEKSVKETERMASDSRTGNYLNYQGFDSKRIVNRTKIFQFFNGQSKELPKFNYEPK